MGNDDPDARLRFPGLDLEPRRLPTPGTCPGCGYDLSDRPARGNCPECGLPYQGPEVLLEGSEGKIAPLLTAALVWSLVILAALLLSMAWLAGSLGALMTAHIGYLAAEHAGRLRLVVLAQGVALIRGERLRRFTRWHLFDGVRVRSTGAGTCPRWKLTLVNAYKPSISTFLHSRGTDAAIFAECVEFEFDATTRDALDVEARVRTHITRARERFRAIRLREMGLVPLDREQILRLRECPSCRGPVTHDDLDAGACPACGATIERGDFTLNGSHQVAHPALAVVATGAIIAAAGFAAAGAFTAALGVAGASVLASALWLIDRGRAGPPPVILATREGLEIWPAAGTGWETLGAAAPLVHAWASVGTIRCALLVSGHWRIAAWADRKSRAAYSPMLFTWLVSPRGGPLFDVILEADEREGRVICEEIERRGSGVA